MSDPHAVLTGPIKTSLTLSDGTVVDVRPYRVFVDTLDQAHELAHLISQHYAAHGHPDHDAGDPFVYDVETSRANLSRHPLNRQEA